MTAEAASAIMTKPKQSTLGQKFRARRSAHIRQMIDTIHAEKGSCRIIDLGGTEQYWRLFEPSYLASKNVSVALVNPLPDVNMSHMFTGMSLRELIDHRHFTLRATISRQMSITHFGL